MKKKIANLVNLSRAIGSNIAYVQGGGGNISVKISDDLMAIKASGYELKNLTETDGFAFVNHAQVNKKIAELCKNGSGSDEEFSHEIKAATQKIDSYPDLRPSMETGFHSLLPFNYVVHSHSVYVAILLCSLEGKKIAEEIFSDFLWISYENPGWNVTAAIFNGLKKQPKPKIIFLQNHGLIVAGDDENEVLNLHESINQKIKNYFKIAEFSLEKVKIYDQKFIHSNIIFPDQVVFGLSKEFAESEVARHIFAAYSFILRSVEEYGLKPVFLEQKNVDFIANMESEKYRKEVAKK